ncbi:MAG: SDR family NAD(P)-dependent oxidoreductase [Pseudomonadota bacterium]
MDTWTVVTGASSGLGADFARIAAKERRNIVISARREDRLKALAEELTGLGAQAVEVVAADLADATAADTLWNAAVARGPVDNLVNNAGLGAHDPFESGDWGREAASIEVNIKALTGLMKLAVPHMKEAGRGRILNVASVAGFLPGPGMAVYNATKAYVVSLSEAVAEELSGTKVTVTALCPGATQTEFFDSADMGSVRLVKSGGLPTSMSVARAGWAGAKAGQRLVVPGASNWMVTQMPRVLPRSALTKIIKRLMAKEA